MREIKDAGPPPDPGCAEHRSWTMTQDTVDVLREAPDEPIVHWMERPPMGVAPMVIGGAVVGAFLLGALAVMGASALLRRLAGDED